MEGGQLISIYRELKFTIKSPKPVCPASRDTTISMLVNSGLSEVSSVK